MTNLLFDRNIILMKQRQNLRNDESGIIIFVIIVLVAMISLLAYRVMSAQNQATNTNTIEDAQKATEDNSEARQRAGRALDAIR